MEDWELGLYKGFGYRVEYLGNTLDPLNLLISPCNPLSVGSLIREYRSP